MSIDYKETIKLAYNGFNNRDARAVLKLMAADVCWPKAFLGGYVQGHLAVYDYWMRQWSEINPHVSPLMISEMQNGEVAVKVQQLVKNLDGEILFDGVVTHIFKFEEDLIVRMNIEL